jgi:hypothetical protein
MKTRLEALTGNAQIIGSQNEQREYFAVFRMA